MAVKRQKYNTTFTLVVQSGYVDVVEQCNGFTVTNTGNTLAHVNGMILYPGTPGTNLGDSRGIGGNEGEIFDGSIQVIFGAGSTPQVEIIQKFYSE